MRLPTCARLTGVPGCYRKVRQRVGRGSRSQGGWSAGRLAGGSASGFVEGSGPLTGPREEPPEGVPKRLGARRVCRRGHGWGRERGGQRARPMRRRRADGWAAGGRAG
eukprot:5860726-Alexandrium_andersonii.AAC.1